MNGSVKNSKNEVKIEVPLLSKVAAAAVAPFNHFFRRSHRTRYSNVVALLFTA